MFFCPNCNNAFDITKDTQRGSSSAIQTESSTNVEKVAQTGGDLVEDVLNKILNNETVTYEDVKNIPITDITKNENYKKLKPKFKEYVYNKIQDLQPVETKIFDENVDMQNIKPVFFVLIIVDLLKK